MMHMRRGILRCFYAVILLVSATQGLSASDSAQCPSEIKSQQSLGERYDGWTGATESTRYPLVSIRLSEGNPSELVWLMPSTTKNPTIHYWILPKSDRGYWISCGYGSTSLILFRQLPKGSSKCTVWFDKDFLPPTATKYECN